MSSPVLGALLSAFAFGLLARCEVKSGYFVRLHIQYVTALRAVRVDRVNRERVEQITSERRR